MPSRSSTTSARTRRSTCSAGRRGFWAGPSVEELKEIPLREGENFHIPTGTVHRMEAITDCDILEASTPDLDDVVRLEDRYGRV